MRVGATVKKPDLSLHQPDNTFYKAAAIEIKKRIRVRTETSKKDHKGRAFKAYDPEYRIFRVNKGRSAQPNLSFTGRMLGAMQVRSSKKTGSVVLSGEEAQKARGNENKGRIFFAFSDDDIKAVLMLVANWMGRKNKLKR